jgi:hypothetical protein
MPERTRPQLRVARIAALALVVALMAVPSAGARGIVVTRSEFGPLWPLKAESATLICTLDQNAPTASLEFLEEGSRRFALNALAAESVEHARPIRSALVDDPASDPPERQGLAGLRFYAHRVCPKLIYDLSCDAIPNPLPPDYYCDPTVHGPSSAAVRCQIICDATYKHPGIVVSVPFGQIQLAVHVVPPDETLRGDAFVVCDRGHSAYVTTPFEARDGDVVPISAPPASSYCDVLATLYWPVPYRPGRSIDRVTFSLSSTGA